MSNESRLDKLVSEWLRRADREKQQQREANKAGRVEMDAYRDGKYMALNECISDLDYLITDQRYDDLWAEFITPDSLCSLCGNTGIIDTRGVRSQAGVDAGRLNYCVCPNGRELKRKAVALDEWITLLSR